MENILVSLLKNPALLLFLIIFTPLNSIAIIVFFIRGMKALKNDNGSSDKYKYVLKADCALIEQNVEHSVRELSMKLDGVVNSNQHVRSQVENNRKLLEQQTIYNAEIRRYFWEPLKSLLEESHKLIHESHKISHELIKKLQNQ